jgi:hypothetical protein
MKGQSRARRTARRQPSRLVSRHRQCRGRSRRRSWWVRAIGAFTVHNAEFDIGLMLAFRIVGYVFKKLDYPL